MVRAVGFETKPEVRSSPCLNQLPHLDGVIPVNLPTVWGDGEGIDRTRMAQQRAQLAAGRKLPHVDDSVVGAGC